MELGMGLELQWRVGLKWKNGSSLCCGYGKMKWLSLLLVTPIEVCGFSEGAGGLKWSRYMVAVRS
ncbi:hypothetical protein C5167_022956 [Papaver somniferum]|uniref:Uncharacterized protein n=1 Tax=Papaver somniferum TaxID=3469 RepID=A0A4Y7JN19_PAPSO|nr:hypothetical protein C5167_022956 [Papaver somniferum]